MIFPQDTFNAFDHAGDGFIDSEKMAQVLANLGLQFQQNDIVEVIQVRDPDVNCGGHTGERPYLPDVNSQSFDKTIY